MKTDNEPTILSLKQEAVRLAREEVSAEALMEESMAYVSQVAVVIESAVRQVEEKVRILRVASEELHGTNCQTTRQC